jgi:ribosomal protein S7
MYNSQKLGKVHNNYMMWDGKKETARKIVYKALILSKKRQVIQILSKYSILAILKTLVLLLKYVHVVSVVQTTRFLVKFAQNAVLSLAMRWIISSSWKR